MSETIEMRRNWAMWIGFLLAVTAWLCNVAFFANAPAQRAIPWLSLLLALAALVFAVAGLWRIFASSRIHRGRILSSVLSLLSILLAAVAIFAFFRARALPVSSAVPQVGQKAPDFTLADTTGQPVSLNQLFAPAADGVVPKEVLLIFYRGYW